MFFLNPFAMVIGGALISAPILIHLINRMRFKRVRWAAMEFLLKSQKRNRRRLIIEQLILLALRCLLVLLFGFLAGRLVHEAVARSAGSSTTHVVLIDNTLSMADRAPKNQAEFADGLAQAKAQIKELAGIAAQAQSPQTLILIAMSDRNQPLFNERLNDESLGRLRKTLDELPQSLAHVSPTDAVESAKAILTNVKESRRLLHIVSDFRDQDWNGRPANDKLHASLKDIADGTVPITLIDCSVPSRSTSRAKSLEFHNNFAITDLRPEKRVVPAGVQVPFTMEVENLGNESRDSIHIRIYKDGSEDHLVSRVYDNIPPPGTKQRYTFEMNFEGPGAGQTARFHRVTAILDKVDVQSGIQPDNVRHAIIEVRKPKNENDLEGQGVPTLVIDGNGAQQGQIGGGDARVIKDALKSLKGIESVNVVVAENGLNELLRPDLEREYATIFLLNIDRLGEEKKETKDKDKPKEPKDPQKEKEKEEKRKASILGRLRQYVANGGNIVWFTGEKVDRNYYNDILFEEAQGLFPVPIAEDAKSNRLRKEDIDALRRSFAPKMYVIDKHEITRGLGEMDKRSLADLIIPQYTLTKPRFEWTQPWSHESDVKDLLALANLTKNDNTARKQMSDLFAQVNVAVEGLKNGEAVKARAKKMTEDILKVSLAAGDDGMYQVVEAIDLMMNDRGSKPGEKENVSLEDFWAHPDKKDVRTAIQEFRKAVLLGAPLAVTRKYGKGNVVAFLTTAGQAWSGWSGGELAGPFSQLTFPIIIADLQKYLTRGGDAGQRMVGDTIRFELDPAQYREDAQRIVQVDEGQADKIGDNGIPIGFKVDNSIRGQLVDGKLVFDFPAARTTGVHEIRVFPIKEERPESRFFVFNIDTQAESNLRRVATEEVARNPSDPPASRAKIGFNTPKEMGTTLRERKTDFSESPWLYLFFLVVLIVEQALAVHLSFHVKGGDAGQGKGQAAPAASGREQAQTAAVAAS